MRTNPDLIQSMPRTGRALEDWARERDGRLRSDCLGVIRQFARRQGGYPESIADWSEAQVLAGWHAVNS